MELPYGWKLAETSLIYAEREGKIIMETKSACFFFACKIQLRKMHLYSGYSLQQGQSVIKPLVSQMQYNIDNAVRIISVLQLGK